MDFIVPFFTHYCSSHRTFVHAILFVTLINIYYNELEYINTMPVNSIYSLDVRFNCGLLKALR